MERGATAEKAPFLVPNNRHALADRICIRPHLLGRIGQVETLKKMIP